MRLFYLENFQCTNFYEMYILSSVLHLDRPLFYYRLYISNLPASRGSRAQEGYGTLCVCLCVCVLVCVKSKIYTA